MHGLLWLPEQWRSPVLVLPDGSRGSVGFSVSGRIIWQLNTQTELPLQLGKGEL